MHALLPKLAVPLVLLTAAGCAGEAASPERPVPAEPTLEAVAPESTPPEPAPSAERVEASFDFRLLGTYPERYIGTEQLCDLTHSGRLRTVEARTAVDYPLPAAHRRLIRCSAATGSGWADLVFQPESSALAPYVTAGKRIRTRVVLASGGFEDNPVVEFVATVGAAHREADLDELLRDVSAAFDFRRPSEEEGLVGQTRPCAVTYAGAPEEVSRPRQGYPAGAALRMDLSCGHAAGEAWVDLAMLDGEVVAAMAIRRGDTLQLRIRRAEGGRAAHPIVTLVP